MRRLLLVLLALAAVVPTAGAVPTTLYGHVLSKYQDFVMNTQEPGDVFHLDEPGGIATMTVTCAPPTPATASQTSYEYHTMYGYSSPAPVDYLVMGKDGQPRFHPERGVQADVLLDPMAPMVMHWYLSQPLPAQASPQQSQPMPTPNVVVQVTMRTGDAISVDDEAYNSGTILAQGRSVPATLAGEFSQGVEHEVVGEHRVYHFAVPMEIQSTTIPRAEGFNVRIDTFVDNPYCSEGTLMPNSVNLHTSPGHRPRLELGVLNPVEFQAVHPQFVGDDLVVHVSLMDVWGPYNVELASFNLTLEGPGLAETPLELVHEPVERYHETYHGHGPHSVTATWILNGTPVPPGTYTVRLSAVSLQGSVANWEGQFQLGEPVQAMPVGLAPVLLALGVAAVAAAGRRR